MKFTGNIGAGKQGRVAIRVAVVFLIAVIAIGLLAPFIANDRPLYIHDGSRAYWPILSGSGIPPICEEVSCTRIDPLIPFSTKTLDLESTLKPPGTSGHSLGTDALGRDVLSGLIYGARTAIFVGIPAAMIALLIGLIYGLAFGYYGDDKLTMSSRGFWVTVISVPVGIWLFLFIRNLHRAGIIDIWLVLLYLVLWLFVYIVLLKRGSNVSHRNQARYRAVPADSFGMRIVDMVKALPPLFIVLFALQLIDGSGVWSLIYIISFLLWATFARHSRAEVLRIRNKPSVHNAVLSGRSDLWIWKHELLPFVVRPLIVTFSFSMASAILLEATLSFLGIGLPVDHVSWGTLINDARQYTDAWWLLVWPGLCLIALIWSIQYVGHYIENKLRFGKGMKFG